MRLTLLFCAALLAACRTGGRKAGPGAPPIDATPQAAAPTSDPSSPLATAPAAMPQGATPKALVYKTRADRSRNVPVTLSADGAGIVAYPHPSDLKAGDAWLTPTPLGVGYLLDNKGIGPRTAFLAFTYEEYARLPEAPSLGELLKQVVDKKPLAELWDCGSRNAPGLRDRIDRAIAEKNLAGLCAAVPLQ